jgi:hypothetical protein
MNCEELGEEILEIKARLIVIETDMKWCKAIFKILVLGVASLIGIDITPYLL